MRSFLHASCSNTSAEKSNDTPTLSLNSTDLGTEMTGVEVSISGTSNSIPFPISSYKSSFEGGFVRGPPGALMERSSEI